MKVGVNEAAELKMISEMLKLPFANVLHAYAIEDILLRISKSEFNQYLLLFNGEEEKLKATEFNSEGKLQYFYRKSTHKMVPNKIKPGVELSEALMEVFLQKVFWDENKNGIEWVYNLEQEEDAYHIVLSAKYKDMTVPVNMWVKNAPEGKLKTTKEEITPLLQPDKQIIYLAYSAENFMGKHLFEIVNKLELIGDMEAYALINDILKSQPVSGRRIVEELYNFTENNQRVLRQKRIEQIKGYRNYAYMKNRWVQYCKRRNISTDPWEEVVDRLCSFLEPLWISLCKNEIFLDDWMPELERFLS